MSYLGESLTVSSKEIADLYSKNLEDFGPVPKSVGWHDVVSQHLRFKKLIDLFNFDNLETLTVNDFGCGYGAFFQYLDKLFPNKLKHYYGYDISEQMIQSAQQKIKDPRVKFISESKTLHQADYSFVSGTFHVKLAVADESWLDFIKKMLVELNSKSSKGFAFNMLSTYVDWKQDHLYYADPFVFFDLCKRKFSKYVTLLHDYPLFEWTILVHKELRLNELV
jgi:SAM-dependent methyltransferase